MITSNGFVNAWFVTVGLIYIVIVVRILDNSTLQSFLDQSKSSALDFLDKNDANYSRYSVQQKQSFSDELSRFLPELAAMEPPKPVSPYTCASNTSLGRLELDEDRTIGYTYKTLGSGLASLFSDQLFPNAMITLAAEAGDADTFALSNISPFLF